jgi:rod shape-determining protein MreD
VQRNQYLRRVLLSILVFLVAMAQNVPWLPAIFGVRPLPLVPLVVCIAVLDQEIPAIAFGVFAGLLWDYVTPGFPWHAIYLCTVAFACAVLTRYIINRNRLTIALLILFASLGYILLRWLVDFAFAPSAVPVLFRHSLPSLAYTLLLAPLCYFSTNRVVQRTSRKQRGVLHNPEGALALPKS